MTEDHLSDTQPIRLPTRRRSVWWLLWVFLSIILVGGIAVAAGILGYQSGMSEISRQQAMDAIIALQEQYTLGVQDFHSGRYDLARQRFEYVIANDPGYPGATNRLAEVIRILIATATPSPIPATVTPTPTHDFGPVDDIYRQAQEYFSEGDWNSVIDACMALRREDPTYHVVEVDSLLYRALQNRGVDKIRKASNLEGGIYDLTLAERFGPLDAKAQGWRNLARLYLIGSSFWEVYPEQAVYFFGQVAYAAPFLRDASGWTAMERYRASLIQYGDQLVARGDWCTAQEQYSLALAIRGDDPMQVRATDISYQCALPTELAASITLTAPPTASGTMDIPTLTVTSSATPTGYPTILPTITFTNTPDDLPTLTPTPLPTDTVTPMPQPLLTETPTQPPDQSHFRR